MGNAEMQMWYRTRNTFHSSGGDNLNWVQWRNEVFFWLVYDDFVKNGKVFNQDNLAIPFVKNATFNARYRFRADPMYSIRKHYQNIYDDEERESFIFPENGFRDLTLDMDLGQVGPGSLSIRVGNQQIVWGESDLYRSIDIINPLRIDQGQGVGEKFDEFRTPIWALTALQHWQCRLLVLERHHRALLEPEVPLRHLGSDPGRRVPVTLSPPRVPRSKRPGSGV
jgi:hypothetical protein